MSRDDIIRMALESLDSDNPDIQLRAATALRAALAQPVPKPVAWLVYTEGGTSVYVTDNPNDLVGAYRALPLYTAPPQRKPLSLTDLQEALVYTNLIDRDAIDNPEEYDEGSTLAQIDELYRIITELLNPR